MYLEKVNSYILFPFALVIFETGSHFMPVLAWSVILLFVLPYIAGMTAMD
jgi:hypothetical protein